MMIETGKKWLPKIVILTLVLVMSGSPLVTDTVSGAETTTDPETGVVTIEGEAWDEKNETPAHKPNNDKGYFVRGTVPGTYLIYRDIDFGDVTGSIDFHVGLGSGFDGGKIDVHLDGLDGPAIARFTVNSTGGWRNFQTKTVPVRATSGVHDLVLKFWREPDDPNQVGAANIDWIKFKPKTLTRVDVRPGPIGVGEGISFEGTAEDGSTVDLTDSIHSAYATSDDSVINVNADGTVRAIGTGTATVTGTFSGDGVSWEDSTDVAVVAREQDVRIEAESFDDRDSGPYSGVPKTEGTSDTGGGENLGWTKPGTYVVYQDVSFGTATDSIDLRVASRPGGGYIELWRDAASDAGGGTLMATVPVAATGGWQDWVTLEDIALTGASGVHDLFLKFTRDDPDDARGVANINWMAFTRVVEQLNLETLSAEADRTKLMIGEEASISLAGQLTDGSAANFAEGTVSYASADPSILTVDGDGTVIGQDVGTTNVTATVDLYNGTQESTVAFEVITVESLALLAEEDSVGPGRSLQLQVIGTYGDGTEEDLTADETITYTSSDESIATVNEEGLLTAADDVEGAVTVTATYQLGTVTKSATLDIEVRNQLESVDVTAEDYVFVLSNDLISTTLSVAGTMSSGKPADLSAADVRYQSSDESIATVDENGQVTAHAPGEAIITVSVTLNGVDQIGEWRVLVYENEVTNRKTRLTHYTEEMRANAGENIQEFDWAAAEANNVIQEADKILTLGYDHLWGLMTPQTLGRSLSVNWDYDSPFKDKTPHGIYDWVINPVDENGEPMRWKVKDPYSGYIFPTNDWRSYYESGLDENGIFRHELADDKYLVNELYPEKGEKWGVDDGRGWVDENGRKWMFAAYYIHWTYRNTINDHINTLRDAYLYTGDVRYARAGIILLDRVADIYPSLDLHVWKWGDGYKNSHGLTGQGKMIGAQWEPITTKNWIRAYEAFYPAMDDPQVIEFLSGKSQQYRLNPKHSGAAIRKNIEDGILINSLDAVKKAQLSGGFGRTQSLLSLAAVVLDDPAEENNMTKAMLDFVMQWGEQDLPAPGGRRKTTGGNLLPRLMTDVDRNGQASQAAPNYNRIKVGNINQAAEFLQGYDRFPAVDLFQNPKFKNMLYSQPSIMMVGKYAPSLGDSGSLGYPHNYMNKGRLINAYRVYKEPRFARVIYALNGNTIDGIHGSIFSENPDQVAKDIQADVEKYGTWNLPSNNLTGFGYAALRDGEAFVGDYGVRTHFNNMVIADSNRNTRYYNTSNAIQFQAEAPGDYITYEFEVPAADTYDIVIQPFEGPGYGAYDISIDGEKIASYDFYESGWGATGDVTLARLSLSAGTHTINFEVTGQTEGSSGYKMALKFLELLNEEARELKKRVQRGDTRRGLWVYYGRHVFFHPHYDQLNLDLYAYGIDLAPDFGYPEKTVYWPKSTDWEENTVAHNTVVVDRNKQKRSPVGWPHHFEDSATVEDYKASGRVKLADVAQDYAYHPTTDMYRRTTAMIRVDENHSYTVDFFRVKGGNEHDFSFHSTKGTVTTEGLALTPQETGTYAGPDVEYEEKVDSSGFEWLKNVERDSDPASRFSVDWDVDDFRNASTVDGDVHFRLTMLGDYDEASLADGVPPRRGSNPATLKFVLVKNKGENLHSTYTSVMEPYVDDRYIESIEAVEVTHDGAVVNNEDVKAVKVTLKSGRVDYIVNTLDTDKVYVVDGKFEFQGFFGVYSEVNGKQEYGFVTEGGRIGTATQRKAAVTGSVTDFTDEISLENEIVVQLDRPLQVGRDALVGRYVSIDNNYHQVAQLEPEEEQQGYAGVPERLRATNAVYKIEGVRVVDEAENTYALDIGDTTVIRGFVDPTDFSRGYKTDFAVGDSASIHFAKEQTDFIPPRLKVQLDKTELWPADHRMVDITADVTATDDESGLDRWVLLSIESNESDNGVGDGNTEVDIAEAEFDTPDTEFQLRAERSGTAEERTYTVTYQAWDKAGNTTIESVEVVVPRDERTNADTR